MKGTFAGVAAAAAEEDNMVVVAAAEEEGTEGLLLVGMGALAAAGAVHLITTDTDCDCEDWGTVRTSAAAADSPLAWASDDERCYYY